MSVQIDEEGISLLKSNALVSLADSVETILYTCPVGKNAVITHFMVCKASESLSSVDSVTFGTNAGTRNDWDATVRTFALVTGATLALFSSASMVADTAEQVSTAVTSGGTWGIKVGAAGGAAVTATIKVFGIEFDA